MSTENGANIGGDVDTGGGNFIGRDHVTQNIINNIVVVSEFLNYSGVMELIKDIPSDAGRIDSISNQLIKDITENQPSDLSTSLSFTGQIIKDFLKIRLKDKPFALVGTRQAMDDLAEVIGSHLANLNYWDEYSVNIDHLLPGGYDPEMTSLTGINLPLTTKLFKDTFVDYDYPYKFYLINRTSYHSTFSDVAYVVKSYQFAIDDHLYLEDESPSSETVIIVKTIKDFSLSGSLAN